MSHQIIYCSFYFISFNIQSGYRWNVIYKRSRPSSLNFKNFQAHRPAGRKKMQPALVAICVFSGDKSFSSDLRSPGTQKARRKYYFVCKCSCTLYLSVYPPPMNVVFFIFFFFFYLVRFYYKHYILQFS